MLLSFVWHILHPVASLPTCVCVFERVVGAGGHVTHPSFVDPVNTHITTSASQVKIKNCYLGFSWVLCHAHTGMLPGISYIAIFKPYFCARTAEGGCRLRVLTETGCEKYMYDEYESKPNVLILISIDEIHNIWSQAVCHFELIQSPNYY